MTATTLTRTCWALRPEDEWEDMHFPTQEAAQAVVDGENADREPDEDRYHKSPEELGYRCIEIRCDECGGGLDDEDNVGVLHLTADELAGEEKRAEGLGWTVVRLDDAGNLHYCPDDNCQAAALPGVPA